MVRYKLVFWCLLVSIVWACSTPQTKTTPSEPALHAPPSEIEATAMPAGPPVDTEAIRPRKRQQAEWGELAGNADAIAVLTRAQLKDFLGKGPAYALTVIEVEPVRKEDQFWGYSVKGIAPSARSFLGPSIVEGDVITRVNGIRPSNPDEYLQAWQSLHNVSLIRVDIVRGEEARVVSWTVD